MDFQRSLNKLLEHSEGYVKDYRDPSKESYHKISRKWFPLWEGFIILDKYDDKGKINLGDLEELDNLVTGFYYDFFWKKIHAHEIEDEFIAEMLFNLSVNLGKKQIVRKVQRVCGVNVDGVMGPITVAAINNSEGPEFIYHFLLEIMEFYVQLGTKQPRHILHWMKYALHFYYAFEKQNINHSA